VKAILVNGDSINYIDIGKGDPVVFVHGALGDYRTWEAQMDTFAIKPSSDSLQPTLCLPQQANYK
jgi:pimeloyl-ACP methyl ester carboxylesterase